MQRLKFSRPFLVIVAFLLITLGLTLAVRFLHKEIPQETPPPNSLIVSKTGCGQYESIGEAISNASPGMRILVRPGVYKEKVIIDRPIEVIGDKNGTDDEVVIENTSAACLWVRAKRVTVRGLTLRGLPKVRAGIFRLFQGGKPVEEPAVEVTESQCVIEDCDITSEAVAGIGIQGYLADPVVRRCRIHDGDANGIWMLNHAKATIEDCEFWGTNWAALRVEDGASAALQRSRIHDVKNGGVVLLNYARATINDCDIFDNAMSGVEARARSSATISKTRIHGCREHGIWFRGNSTGQVEHCEVSNNGMVGLQLMEDSSPIILASEIHDNLYSNIEIDRGADPVVRGCKVYGGAGSGVYVYESARGTVEDCEIFGQQRYQAVSIRTGANPTFRKCKIYDSPAGGVLVGDATATLEDCDIYNNGFTGVWARQNASPTIRRCKINRNGRQAIAVHENASASVEDSDLTANLGGAWDIRPECAVRSVRNKE